MSKVKISERSVPVKDAVLATAVNALDDYFSKDGGIPSIVEISDRSVPTKSAVIAKAVNSTIAKLQSNDPDVSIPVVEISDRSVPTKSAVLATVINDIIGTANASRRTYLLDGVDDYFTTYRKTFNTSDTLTVKYVTPASPESGVLCSDSVDGVNVASFDSQGALSVLNATYTVDGVSNGVLSFDGVSHTVVLTFTGTTYVDTWGASYTRNSGFLTGVILDVDYDGVNVYPVNDGWSLNPMIDDTLNPQSGRPELLTNGEFDTDTDWVKGGGWVIADGKASMVNSPGWSAIYQVMARPARYEITINIVSITGFLRFFDGVAYSSFVDSPGIFKIVVDNRSVQYSQFTMRSDSGTSVEIESVSVKEYSHATLINGQQTGWRLKDV